MLEFSKIPKVNPVGMYGTGMANVQGKKETNLPDAVPANVADVVQISADAAYKGKLNAFSAVLFKEMNAAGADRIARLKEKYAGDGCPVSGADIAGAIIARIRVEGLGLADGSFNE